MSIAGKLLRCATDPDYRFLVMASHRLCNRMPDEQYLARRFQAEFGYPLNLGKPKTFNEKIQWLKLYDRRPEYTAMVDKVEAKNYVAGIIGEEYIIPTLGVWDSFDEIDFDKLPDRFVLKCTHDSGGLVICRDKSAFDKKAAGKKINKCLTKNYFWGGREWPYKDIKPRILAEQYLEDDAVNDLWDFKIHCFNGQPKVILVCKDRHLASGMTEDFYDCAWEHLDIRRPTHPQSEHPVARPAQLDRLLKLSEKLSQNIPFLRTDWYIVNNRIYFGELTFYPNSGFVGFLPSDADARLGEMLDISSCEPSVP